jgi:hypothetical protein
MKHAVSAATMRHIFTIRVVDKLPGIFGPRRYLYHCARCKWSFVVNDGRRGVLTPVGDHGEQLAHDEAVARAATFALGPCPAMHVLHQAMSHVNGSNGNGRQVAAEHVDRTEPRH